VLNGSIDSAKSTQEGVGHRGGYGLGAVATLEHSQAKADGTNVGQARRDGSFALAAPVRYQGATTSTTQHNSAGLLHHWSTRRSLPSSRRQYEERLHISDKTQSGTTSPATTVTQVIPVDKCDPGL
jgi:hypothetical protein